MIRANAHRFGAIRTLVLVGFFPIGLLTSTAIPALAGSSGTWATTGSMNTARDGGTATLLSKGQVLVAGGLSENVLASAELYDPARGMWTVTGSLNTARADHTATLLPNGQVLVAGGFGATLNTFSSAELYDPATGKWTVTGSMNTPRDSHTATLLPNGGVVLVAGGEELVNNSFVIFSSAEIYNPFTGTWTKTSSMSAARATHTATLLPNGQVLVAGGDGSSNSSLSSAEL
jgi:N-acetylneuraminic acid mutarotase